MEEKITAEQKPVTEQKPKRSSRKKQRVCEHLSFAAKEAFKRLRTNLVMSFPDEDTLCKIVGVTSAQPSDGKSTIALNLSYSLAELGKRVLLIDADMRRASIHAKIDIEKTPGLSNLLDNLNTIQVTMKEYTSSTGPTKFKVIPSGDVPDNPSELLSSRRMAALLSRLAESFDYIIVDLPPVGAVIDAVSMAKLVDGMIVVIRENSCPRSLLDECVGQLNYAGIKILGFVVNGALEGSSKKYQYKKGYGYGYGGYYYGK
ncbi:MAG: CpsD/CapB family tyrosine-protein kinase [Clostridia bacterium]|nr:CpsD/CapB family tyrosine-protein kinase [Clostridia bacterium]